MDNDINYYERDEYYDDETRSATRIHDSNTINANTGKLTESEVVAFCNKLRISIKKMVGTDSQFVVNTITCMNKETGKRDPLGVSFIYWRESSVYHILLGNNPDGTSRIVTKPDPNWVPPKKEEEEVETGMSKSIDSWSDITTDPEHAWGEIVGSSIPLSWADMTESTPKYEAPTVIEHLPPLINDFTFKRKDGEVFDILMQPFFINIHEDVLPNCDTNKLFGFVPKNVTVQDIVNRFKIFSHSNGYPKVNMNPCRNATIDKNLVFITFASFMNDAKFAKEIMKYTKFGDTVVQFDFPLSQEKVSPRKSSGYRSKSNYEAPVRKHKDYDYRGGRGRWGGRVDGDKRVNWNTGGRKISESDTNSSRGDRLSRGSRLNDNKWKR
jgi:hypothetical protein